MAGWIKMACRRGWTALSPIAYNGKTVESSYLFLFFFSFIFELTDDEAATGHVINIR